MQVDNVMNECIKGSIVVEFMGELGRLVQCVLSSINTCLVHTRERAFHSLRH